MVTFDTLYNYFYTKLKFMLFRDEGLWSPEGGGDEFVEQV